MLIKKGRHYGTPFPFPKFFGKKINRFFKTKNIVFDDTIRYDIGEEDQNDVNKLFGFSYGLHHTDSDRIGFRYNIKKKCVELVLYSYECGVRLKTKHLCYVKVGEKVSVTLYVGINEDGNRELRAKVYSKDKDKVVADVTEMHKIKNAWIRYSLGLYFGGNQTAPHKIVITEWVDEEATA